METIKKIYIRAIYVVVGVCIGFYARLHTSAGRSYHNVTIVDTTYNHVTLDSIKYVIRIKDSIIVKLKRSNEYEIDKAINANDSDAVKQFYSLASAE